MIKDYLLASGVASSDTSDPSYVRPEIRARFKQILYGRLQRACVDRGVSEVGAHGFDVSTPRGLVVLIAGVEKLCPNS